MPDFVTHHLFGEKVLAAFPAVVQLAAARRPAVFHWGLHGPDPLFFYGLAHGSPLHKYGNRMHSEHMDVLFFTFSRAVSHMTDTRREIAEAYFYGFLCHYALDSTVHPYVYCRQQEWLAASPGHSASSVHCQIESDIDSALYKHIHNASVTEFRPKEDYQLTEEETATLSVLLHYLLHSVYNVSVPTAMLRQSYASMLRIQSFLCAENPLLYRGLLQAERLIGCGAPITSHMKTGIFHWDCLNLQHQAWYNPWDPAIRRTESVPDLLDTAQQMTVSLAGQYAAEFDAGWLLLHHFEHPFDCGNPKNH